MSRFQISLDQVKVASPCPASWDAMTGDDRVRFCSQCSLHVYNLSALSREAAESLVTEKEGKMCVRFFQRADGTVITTDCPVGWAAVKRRLAWTSTVAGLMFVVVFGVIRACVASGNNRSHQRSQIEIIVSRVRNYFFPQPIAGKICVVPTPIVVPTAGQQPAENQLRIEEPPMEQPEVLPE